MNRNVYLAGIIGLTMLAIFVSFWMINHLIHGAEFNQFVAFPSLVVIDGIIALFCEVILLMYFYSKKYKVAFVVSLLSAITFLVLYTELYRFLVREVGSGDFINLAVTVHLIAVTMFSLGLVLSKASERPLLKKAGYLGAAVGLILLSIHVVALNMPEGAILNVLIDISTLVGRVGELIVVFYILNFYQELRSEANAVLQT